MDAFNDTDVDVMKKQDTLESFYLFASLLAYAKSSHSICLLSVRHIYVT